ncbi:hypothetical protein [Paraburkholderia sp. DGU8]|uniref:hypothetical protein n=1 Tax=Paraburkholderia sp. DGU8 TaxID=3161997 RepID=UPI003465D282
MSTHDYKGHTIEVWIKSIGGKHFTWSVKAGDLPIQNNSGEVAPSAVVAEEEALAFARRMLDQLIARGHG